MFCIDLILATFSGVAVLTPNYTFINEFFHGKTVTSEYHFYYH